MLLRYQDIELEAGVDEAGRGALAGPVVAAAVILPPDFFHAMIQDSKKLKAEQRFIARSLVLQHAIAWGLGIISVGIIDEINILNATRKAMIEAVGLLAIKPEFVIIDGKNINLFSHDEQPSAYIIKGDQKYLSIAAASILAKTFRDEIMQTLHQEYPIYQWITNKGYPTINHRKTILQEGLTTWHRKSFSVRV